MRVADLDNLEQRVLMTEMAKPAAISPTVAPSFLRLLDRRVHKHGAATSQINRGFPALMAVRRTGDVGFRDPGEALDEAAAARRAGLVEHDVLNHAVLDAQALHVLAADVQDKLNAGQERLGAAQMRDRLDFAGVDAQRLEQQMPRRSR